MDSPSPSPSSQAATGTGLEPLEPGLPISAEEYRTVMRAARDGYIVLDMQGRFLDVNDAFCRMTGYAREELLRMGLTDLGMDETATETVGHLARFCQAGSTSFERRHRRKDGRPLHVEISFIYVPALTRIHCLVRDVTERKQLEVERELTVRMLRLMNSTGSLHELMRAVSRELQEWAGCEVIGIRLLDGEDYPYFETRGLPPEHICDEVSLCSRAPDDQLRRDDQGRASLACLCGAVLRGCAGGDCPGITPRGAFWTNSIRQWLSRPTGRDWPPFFRGRCAQAGYETLALIPLRAGQRVQGLLQVMDHRPNRLTEETVRLLEQVADNLAVAVAHLQAQEKLRVQALVLDQIYDMITVTDLQGRISYVNAAQAQKLGRTPDQLLGQTPHLYFTDPAQAARQQEVLDHTLFEGGWQGELIHADVAGRPFVVSWRTSLVRNELGHPVALCGVGTDVTARRQAEQALRAGEQRFRAVVESSPDGVFIQTDERFAYLNSAAVRLFGATAAAQLLGEPILERLAPEEREAERERMRRVNLERQPVPRVEERFLRLDGSAFEAEVSAVPFRHDGKPGALVFVRDITDRKRLEGQLRHSQKMEAVGQLAGGVAHDFNNILAAAMLHLELLQQNPHLPAGVHESLKELITYTQRAASLTRQLLLFGRRSVLQMRALDVNEVVEELLKMLRRLIGEHIALEWRAKPQLPRVLADVGMLEQVVVNLVVNARDAMPKGGQITIATDTVVFAPETVQATPEARPGTFISLAVSDNGCGMSPSLLKRVFEPFFTTKEAGQGAGLGLATVYSIVQQHQGWITVESELNRGSTFRIFLPVAETSASTTAPDLPAAPDLRGGRETILLVEDEVGVRQTLGSFLRRWGYEVLEAENGRRALQLFREHQARVELLLSDMVMPEGMTGLELAEQLRSAKPGLKVMICSGYSAELVRHGAETMAGLRYLPKPCRPAELAAAVRGCLDER